MQNKCDEHNMWHRHLTLAFWFLLSMGIYVLWFTDSILIGIMFIAGSFSFLAVRNHLSEKHAEWHNQNSKEENDEAR